MSELLSGFYLLLQNSIGFAILPLMKQVKEGLLSEISKGPFDPHKVFILAKPGNQAKRT